MRRIDGEPPRLATWLVKRVVPEGRSPYGLLGDMEERYHRRAERRPTVARVGYWAEAVGAAQRYAIEAGRRGFLERREGGMERWLRDLRVAWGGLGWVAAGLAAGLFSAPFAGGVTRSLLVDVSPLEPSVLAVASGVLILSVLLAAWLPTRRAARVDPAEVLREE